MADIWRTRLVWAGIGAGAAVLAIRIAGPSVIATPVLPVASASSPAGPVPVAAPQASALAPAPFAAVATQSAVSPSVPVAGADPAAQPLLPAPPDADAPATPEMLADPATLAATAADTPTYPLPRMPGMRNLGRIDRFDDARGRWVLTRASRVPAPVFAVESFFSKALEAEGMTVTRVNEPNAADGTRRVTLRGRSKSARAQVAIRQRPDELSTTTRVIWQPGA